MKRVLLMEDNVILALEWKEVFELNHCEVVVTHNGEDAAGYLKSERFDLVITDLFVKASKGGLHVLSLLAKMGSDGPPAIAVTGSFAPIQGESEGDSNLFLQQAQRLGSSATIQKPFPPIELVVLARRLWQQS